jgi:hypothetical protein
MNIDLVIAQLRVAAPFFYGNVAGAAQYETATKDQAWMTPPAAYVVPIDIEAGEMTERGSYYQTLVERIGVIVVLDNSIPVESGDRRGQTSITTFDQVQQAIFKAILNWHPDNTSDNPGNASLQPNQDIFPYVFDGARVLQSDFSRMFIQWDFALKVLISDADGWQPPSQPLTKIDVTITKGASASIVGSANLT